MTQQINYETYVHKFIWEAILFRHTLVMHCARGPTASYLLYHVLSSEVMKKLNLCTLQADRAYRLALIG